MMTLGQFTIEPVAVKLFIPVERPTPGDGRPLPATTTPATTTHAVAAVATTAAPAPVMAVVTPTHPLALFSTTIATTTTPAGATPGQYRTKPAPRPHSGADHYFERPRPPQMD